MLRCVGCGGLVSPWAARCSACGRTTDDAQALAAGDVAPPDGPMGWVAGLARGRPASALPDAATAWPRPSEADSGGEGPSRPRRDRWRRDGWWKRQRCWPRRRGRLLAAATAVVVGVVAGVVAVTSGGGGLPGGEVVSATAAGSIVLTTTTGRVTASIPPVPGTGFLLAADGRYLATGTGQEYVLRGRALASTGQDIPLIGPPGSWRAVDFTDHDLGLVATDSSSSGFGGVEAVTFAGHRTAELGDAESVAGDPAALGVFAVFAAPGTGPGSQIPNPLTDTRIERRDAGAAPVVLAGADQVADDLGETPGTPVILSVLPDPQGDRIAVLVVPAGPRPPRAGIVVLSRNGELLGVAPLAGQGVGQPAWSPDGRSLVYDASTPAHAAIAVWRVGTPPRLRTLPPPTSAQLTQASFTGLGRCLWAVAGHSFLCADSPGGETTMAWLIGRAGGGSLVRVVGPSLPLAWLPLSGTAVSTANGSHAKD